MCLQHCSGHHPQESSPSQQPSDSGEAEETLLWLFTFEDSIHQRSAAALDALRQGTWQGSARQTEKKLRVMMLTGDNEATAKKVARQLQIDEVRAGLSPQQKLQVSYILLSGCYHKAQQSLFSVASTESCLATQPCSPKSSGVHSLVVLGSHLCLHSWPCFSSSTRCRVMLEASVWRPTPSPHCIWSRLWLKHDKAAAQTLAREE